MFLMLCVGCGVGLVFTGVGVVFEFGWLVVLLGCFWLCLFADFLLLLLWVYD